MSGVQSVSSNANIGLIQEKSVPKINQEKSTSNENINVSISIPKDKISVVGKGLLAGGVPATGMAIAYKLSGKAIEHMGDGGIGLGLLLIGAKPAIVSSLTGGAVGALVAPGKPVVGSIAGAVTGAVTGGAISFVTTKQPVLGIVGVVAGGLAGALGGAAGSYISKK